MPEHVPLPGSDGATPTPASLDGDGAVAPLRVLIADDDPLARQAIQAALDGADQISTIPGARTGREAISLALHYRPDIVLMDVSLPEVDGLVATEQIVAQAPEIKIVMLSATEDVETQLASLRAGACGYLLKTLQMSSLPRIVRRVADGEAAITRGTTLELIERLRTAASSGARLRPINSTLTPREWEVLDLLTLGRSTEEIADDLVLTTDTVYSHIKNVLRKLGVHSRAEAVEVAEKMRIEASGA